MTVDPYEDEQVPAHVALEARVQQATRDAGAGRWFAPPPPEEGSESWATTYLDVMTLLLTLFVALMARATLHTDVSESPKPPTLEEVQPAPVAALPPEPLPEPREEPEAEEAADLRVLPMPGLGEQVQVRRVRGGVQLQIQDRVLFEPGSAQLKPAAFVVLDRVAEALATGHHPITVEGHTDDRPIASAKFPSNWELSASRAAAVVRHLVSHRVEKLSVRAVGYADTVPIASNATEEGRARNRRVAIVVTTEAGGEGR